MSVIKQHKFSVAVIGEKEQLEVVHLVAYVANVSEHYNLKSLNTLPLFVPYDSDLPTWAEVLVMEDALSVVHLPKNKEHSVRPCIVCSVEAWLSNTFFSGSHTANSSPSLTLTLDHSYNPKSTQLYDTLLAVNSEYNVRDVSLIVLGSMGSLTVHPVSIHVDDDVKFDTVLFCPSKYVQVKELASVLPYGIKTVPYLGIRPATEVVVLHNIMNDCSLVPNSGGMLHKDILSVLG